MIGGLNSAAFMLLLIFGLYTTMTADNLVKKLIGINLFQASVFLFFCALGKVAGGTPPILQEGYELYSNPLPHVLILTAIVVGIVTTSLGLALICRIRHSHGGVEESGLALEEPWQPASTGEK